MAGEGHIADMITRMKNNQALKLQKKEHQKKLNELFRKGHNHKEDTPFHDVEISEESLTKIKSGIKKELSQETKASYLYTIILTILVISAIVAIAWWGFVK